MSLLWRTAMGWRSEYDHPDQGEPVSVRDAGYAGFTQVSFGADDYRRETPADHPDEENTDLGHFLEDSQRSHWDTHGTTGPVDISGPVYATQSHVHTGHMDRHDKGRSDDLHQGFGGHRPMFVTHRGKLHVVEGHHRVAAAIRRGDSSIEGLHYDLDQHPFQCHADCEYF